MSVDAFRISYTHGRKISMLVIDGGYPYIVGQDGYESIEPVRVAGQAGWVTWFDVYTNKQAIIRINPRYVVSVGYE